MLTYYVSYEIRLRGLRGKWVWFTGPCATDEGYEYAIEYVLNRLHVNGYETRNGGLDTVYIGVAL